MKVTVIGAGAVGGYFGGKLAKAGTDVTFLVRERRYQQLKRRGLNVFSVHGDFRISPKLAKSVEDIECPDLVLVAVKSYHLPDALSAITALASRGARVLPLLNGVSHMEVLRQVVPPNALWGGVCYVESTLDDNGDVRQTSGMQELVLGAFSGSEAPLLSRALDTFLAAEIPATIDTRIETTMWDKYLFLLTLSSITTALRRPIGAALSDPVTSQFLHKFVEELTGLAVYSGACVDKAAASGILNKLHAIHPDMTSSMHRDLEKGQPLELDALQGNMIELARLHGVNTPLLETIYSILHPYKAGVD